MRTNISIAKAGIARLLTAALAVAIAFTFSCSSDDGNDPGGNNNGGSSGGSLAGTVWIGNADKIVFLADNKVEYTAPRYPEVVYGTYTISGNDVVVNYKGNSATLNISYDEIWTYELEGNTLTVKNAIGNPNLAMGGANVGFKLYKQTGT